MPFNWQLLPACCEGYTVFCGWVGLANEGCTSPAGSNFTTGSGRPLFRKRTCSLLAVSKKWCPCVAGHISGVACASCDEEQSQRRRTAVALVLHVFNSTDRHQGVARLLPRVLRTLASLQRVRTALPIYVLLSGDVPPSVNQTLQAHGISPSYVRRLPVIAVPKWTSPHHRGTHAKVPSDCPLIALDSKVVLLDV